MLHKKRSHSNRKPEHHNEEEHPLAATSESPCVNKDPAQSNKQLLQKENVFEEIMAKNFLSLKEKTYPVTESTEGPKQRESKHSHTNTYYS